MNHQISARIGAIAALLLAGAGGAAFAHPHADGEDGKRVERIVIIGDGPGGEHDGKAGDGEVRRFKILRPGGEHEVRRIEIHRVDGDRHAGADGPRVRRFEMHGGMPVDCDDGDKIVDDSAGEGDRKTKVVICTRGKPTAASAEHLERALERINGNDELSAEQKARITTALKSAIDRARGAR